jgi:quinoprotein relay system zinc metallohydrolase 2
LGDFFDRKLQSAGVALTGLAALLHAASAMAAPLTMQEVAPGVFVHAGRHEESTPHNAGDIANIGFIVGAKCVAVIDSGGSLAVGQGLRQAVELRTTKPICYVINTHVHPDHIFGNAAFQTHRPVFVGHRRLAAAMAARGRSYRNALLRDLGASAAGSEIVAPTLEVADEEALDLGGRRLLLKAWPTAHTDNDLSVFDESTGTLWLSDLLFVERIPVVDGSLKGWLAVMQELTTLKPQRVIAGHGNAADWRQALAQQQRYLDLLLRETRRAIETGTPMQQAVDSVGQSEHERWRLFDAYHKRNVTAAYAELEWED